MGLVSQPADDLLDPTLALIAAPQVHLLGVSIARAIAGGIDAPAGEELFEFRPRPVASRRGGDSLVGGSVVWCGPARGADVREPRPHDATAEAAGRYAVDVVKVAQAH